MLTTPADEFGLGLGLPPLPPSPQDLMGQALTTTRDSLAAALPARSRSNHLVLAEVPTDQARQLATRLADALDPIADMLSWARRCLHDSDRGPLNPCDQASSGQRRIRDALLDGYCALRGAVVALRYASQDRVGGDHPGKDLPSHEDFAPYLTRQEQSERARIDAEGRLRGTLRVPDDFGATVPRHPLETADYLAESLATREGITVRVGPVMMGVDIVGRAHAWVDADGILYVKGRVDRALTGPVGLLVDPPRLVRAGTRWGRQTLDGVSVRRTAHPSTAAASPWARGDFREAPFPLPDGDTAGARWQAAGDEVASVDDTHPARDEPRPSDARIRSLINEAVAARTDPARAAVGDHLCAIDSTLDRALRTFAHTPHALRARTKGRTA
ncbi:hypothetical protein ACIP5N_21230 [Streptomyces sp. NPDC088768]|uniref:hypothetical protein n=1 Tax=Streptomyces sp. NPDC088768 TaxID=3365894 RepID=UPI0037FE5BFF